MVIGSKYGIKGNLLQKLRLFDPNLRSTGLDGATNARNCFQLSSDGRVAMLRRNNKIFDPFWVLPKSPEKQSISFWRIDRSDGKRGQNFLIKCVDTMCSDYCVSILAMGVFIEEVILRHENFPVHKTGIVNDSRWDKQDLTGNVM